MLTRKNSLQVVSIPRESGVPNCRNSGAVVWAVVGLALPFWLGAPAVHAEGQLEVRVDRAMYERGAPITLIVSVVGSGVRRAVPDDTSPTPPLDMSLRITHTASKSELPLSPSAAKRRPPGFRTAVVAAGDRRTASFDLRDIYVLPWPEVGEYVIQAQWNGDSAPTTRFRIEAPSATTYEETVSSPLTPDVATIDQVRHCFWVTRAFDETYQLFYQRVDVVSHRATMIASAKRPIEPVVILRAAPTGWHRPVFVAWMEPETIRYADVRSDGRLAYEIREVPCATESAERLSGSASPDSNNIELRMIASGQETGLQSWRSLSIGSDGVAIPAP